MSATAEKERRFMRRVRLVAAASALAGLLMASQVAIWHGWLAGIVFLVMCVPLIALVGVSLTYKLLKR